jgi:hypothetical protein
VKAAAGIAALLLIAVGAASASADTAPPGWELRLPESVTARPGEAGAISLTIAPDEGRTISRDGPVRVGVAVNGAGLVLPRRRYQRADAADSRADAPRFDLRFKAVAAGEYLVEVDVRFWLCGKWTCRPVRDRREVAVRIAEMEAAPDAGAAPLR